MNSSGPLPPPYVNLNENNVVPPPPYRRSIPRYNHDPSAKYKKRSGGFSCLKCICCFYCFLFIFVFVLAGLTLYFYTYYKPQVPNYQVQGLNVKSFKVNPDFSLDTEFLVTVKAENPNENLGFIYGKGSSVIVVYKNSTLCQGHLPAFTQGHKNTTMMKVDLKGKSPFGSGLQEALMDNQKKGNIPLLVKVMVPVNIVVVEFPLRQFTVFVNCSLVVDNLSPNKKVGILSSKYDVDIEF